MNSVNNNESKERANDFIKKSKSFIYNKDKYEENYFGLSKYECQDTINNINYYLENSNLSDDIKFIHNVKFIHNYDREREICHLMMIPRDKRILYDSYHANDSPSKRMERYDNDSDKVIKNIIRDKNYGNVKDKYTFIYYEMPHENACEIAHDIFKKKLNSFGIHKLNSFLPGTLRDYDNGICTTTFVPGEPKFW